ncbi:E3 ubiquitin-protein ligase At1g12760-like isoform X2 [Apium graveolens]|uniref:E3 ubiquitin-protein ligase At1g12760-like isoform X2 n=1 Tax=Apium graveolens TaxID=4045 RepID=UPI003D7A6314
MMPATSTHSLPLLTTMVTSHGSTNRPWNLATLTHYLCRSSSRQSGAVIENLEQLQTACWPATVMFLLLCKMAFIVASIYVMIASHVNEDPDQVQFRVWVVGYAIKCCVHGVWIGLECKKKWDRLWISDSESSEAAREENLGSDERDVVLNIDPVDVVQNDHEEEQTSVAMHLDFVDTMLSFIWWIIGFYWIYIGGQSLIHDSLQLYWLCITFLLFDALIVVIHIAVACIVGLAACFSLPCVLAFLYSMTNQEEEIEDCIQRLPKYKFQKTGVFSESQNEEIQESPCGKMIEYNTDTPNEHVLPLEDAVCCICLSAYEDGKVLRRLPCHHHFHSACIVRWLYLNSTCPLCKTTNIFNYSDREQVFTA